MQPDDFSCRTCSPDSPLASFESSWPRSGFEPTGGAASAWQQNSSMQRQSAPSGSAGQLHSKPAASAADCSHEPRQPGGSPDTASPMQPDEDKDAGPPTPVRRCVHLHHACPWAHAGLETPHTAHQVLLGAAFACPHGSHQVELCIVTDPILCAAGQLVGRSARQSAASDRAPLGSSDG